ncbi:DNA polymerase III subunit alpha [Candidatus Woesebacteria bacterium]|nr:DNA polymerase III subunit alpha [Candidatus Woesebacteria bacterium]
MSNKFVHLHLHSEYSLLDGLSKIGSLMGYVKENGMDSVALTDHGTMYGAIEFYKKAKKEGLKSILGYEAYVTNIDHKERPERGKTQNFHLLLLAQNNEGYKNLMKLTSIAHLEGYYYRPRVDKETLKKYSRGVICTSACAQGEVAQNLIAGNYDEAKKTVEWFLDVFDKNYYLEIQRHHYSDYLSQTNLPEIKRNLAEMAENEVKINEGVVKLSGELGIPIVATNDAHYIRKGDASAQDALVCIATAKNVSEINRLRFIDTPTFYVTTPDEMAETFRDIPESLENTVKVAEKCEVELTLDKWFFPKFKLTEGKTPEEEFEKKVWRGAEARFGKDLSGVYKERLNHEIDIIKQKGYATYFLIVSDMAHWALDEGIITNTRGSAAGSLVSYCLNIININPLDYELPFERFLTPWRPTPPDIDFDIADDQRGKVIEYMEDKYGHDRVAQICTFGRMMARAAVRDISRVLGYQYAIGDRLAKLIPMGSQGFPMSLEKALSISPELKSVYGGDSDAKKILDLAKQVEGNARHVSVHAAGLVIAPTEITDFTPIQYDPEGERIITQYDMDALDPNISPGEAVGLLKFDLLGLRNLSILGASIKTVKETRGIVVGLYEIPLDDEKTFEMLSKGETMGVFQLSGGGMTKYLRDLKPTRVEDLMAMVALYRPGPMAMIPEYIERKNNPDTVKYFDPRMKEYLQKSYGLLVYQDDVLFTAIKIAGYSWEEADKFRKAVGKKIPAEMEKQKEKFIEGCVKNGMDRPRAEGLFKLIEPFSGYGFNKSHAASYGMVAYQTAYMKANYPVEYMCALLTAEANEAEKISQAVNECRKMGIKVLAPDINESSVGFKIIEDDESREGQAIRFGLSAIKNVGKAAIDSILAARKEGNFLTFVDFLSKVDGRKVNKKVVESLIKVGALSSFGPRAVLLSSYDKVKEKVGKVNPDDGQFGLFGQDEMTKISASVDVHLDMTVPEFSEDEIQSLERQLLGLTLSGRPIIDLITPVEHLSTHKINEFSLTSGVGEKVKVVGVVSEIRIVVTKKTASEMAFVKIEDATGFLDLVIFPNSFKQYREILVERKVLVVSGKLDSRNDELSLIVDTLETVESALNAQKDVFIKVPKTATPESLKLLKKLFINNKGNQAVTLVFDDSKKIKLPFTISWSETIAKQISEILEGPPSVVIQ